MTPDELRIKRRRLGWTQASAAEHFGMSLRGYRYLEQGETSAGNAAPLVPPPMAIAMHALELAEDIEVARLSPERLAQFCRSVQREANLHHPPKEVKSSKPLDPDPFTSFQQRTTKT